MVWHLTMLTKFFNCFVSFHNGFERIEQLQENNAQAEYITLLYKTFKNIKTSLRLNKIAILEQVF